MENNKFASFNPVFEHVNITPQSINQYYSTNGIIPDNEYMSKYLTQTAPTPTTLYTPESFNYEEFMRNNYSSIQPISENEVTTNTPYTSTIQNPKNKKDFLKIYEKSAEEASKKTGISKDLLLAQVALETD
jgi:flagellum-specific peptidoglycan hydrolase FlgJ